jgi:hypothetical protein
MNKLRNVRISLLLLSAALFVILAILSDNAYDQSFLIISALFTCALSFIDYKSRK